MCFFFFFFFNVVVVVVMCLFVCLSVCFGPLVFAVIMLHGCNAH